MGRLERKLLKTHPFVGMDPLERLRNAEVLDWSFLPVVSDWSDGLLKASVGKSLLRPAETMVVTRGVTHSLLTLAADEVTTIRGEYETYEDWEHQVPAALYLALDLIVRERETSPRPTPTEVVKEITERRGWSTVEDSTATLLEVEGDLVSHGAVVLREAPEDLAQMFAEDDDARTFNDGLGDVQRRLDYMEKDDFKPWFAKAPLKTARLTEAGKAAVRDATLFRQSREGRLTEQVRMTARRNILFTALMDLLANSRVVLGEVVRAEPDKLARVEGTYWYNLSRLGRPAGDAEDPIVETEPEPNQPGDATPSLPPTPTPAPSDDVRSQPGIEPE